MTENVDIEMPFKHGVDIPQENTVEVWNYLIDDGRKKLDGTAFLKGGQFDQTDIHALKSYYQDVLDYQENKFGEKGAVFNRSLLEHYSLGERIGEFAAPLVGIDSNLFNAVILTHDFGREFSHRRGRNNVIANSLMKKIGFSESFVNLQPPDTLWTQIDKESLKERLHRITTEDGGMVGLIELVDVLAKWKDKSSGSLRKWEDVIISSKAGQNAPDPATMWPSELTRQKKITSSEGDRAIEIKYNYLKDWFEQKSGRKIDHFIKEVEDSLKERPLKGNWI